ncbi:MULTISPECIES: hypothetical protein [Gordonia]|uniref:Uncharacterized protein n=1 Tax=Gordonia amicalis TaxID=89053 RepID=A0AAE4UB87_9ACTN|nr:MULTISPECIES: hypothetical protein [Gordonia]ATD71206.1 hypothetical protein CNO18_13955 [Gordonia sp. 1D]MCZ4579753.1 hypothetical protein [Gordonia amicalis]MDV6308296.1 hypothetical protein [Gordonia amicalis]MDV6313052.1 hypothetical protein [Gordonia amicalis]UKO90103.1 hypothetical protein IHQ52_13610 [Gordonia amicalis]
MVPVTCRTEYLTARHHRSASAAWIVMMVALVGLVGLNIAGVDGLVISAVVAGLLALSLFAAAYGRLGKRGAVLLTVDDDTVYFGDEDRTLVSYPLTALRSFAIGGPADDTSPMAGQRAQHLTVFGQKYLELTFAREQPRVGTGVDEDLDSDFWRVAIIEGDPAAAVVIDRLKQYAPQCVSTQKGSTQKSSTQKSSTRPRAAAEQREKVSVASVSPDHDASSDDHSPVDLRRPRIADAGSDEAAQRLWEEATRRHDEILGVYGSYELDPALLLRYPAVTDVTVEQTQTFHLALDEATALRTDAYPGNRGRADAYQQSVAALRRAWIACEKHGRRIGAGYLEPADRDALDTALKLYKHAEASSTPAEQATYYGRVRDIVTTMSDRGVLHPPEAAVAELHAVTRRALEAGTPQV